MIRIQKNTECFFVREAGLRPHKLHIVSSTINGGSHSFRCSSFSHWNIFQWEPLFTASSNHYLTQKNNRHPKGYRLFLVREAGLEPARPEWTLEPESSESANSTTRAYAMLS